MSKVGIITLNGYFNYGNRLQNYALQEVTKKLGYEVETILNDHSPKTKNLNHINRIIKRVVQLKNLNPIKLKNKIINKNAEFEKNIARQQRVSEFKVFTKNHIKETTYVISNETIPGDLGSRFDYFVAGSDQIWNPHYHSRESVNSAIEYLTFAPREKRLSYAASFGINNIPENYLPRVKYGLQGMESILVREQAGIDIVKDLTSRDAHLVLDPTMLLTRDEWLQISEPHTYKPDKKYLLTYFLGEVSHETKEFINRISKENNLEVIELENYKNVELYKANPSHFIDFINSATLFLTDSFHGCVFSIVLETPFIVFKRLGGKAMYSRIETLLETFKLKNRQIALIKENSLEALQLDLSEARLILEKERERSLTIYRNSFIKY